jgi:peptide/nickel transport system permease protein
MDDHPIDTSLLAGEGDIPARRRGRPWPGSLRAGASFVLLLTLVAVVGPWLARYDPVNGNLMENLTPPNLAHLMGTDIYGRDVFTRVLYGARLALGISVSCVLAALVIGCLIGIVAGYYGGVVETVLMRFVDIVISFPYIVLVIAVLSVLGSGLVTIAIAIIAVDWTVYARLVYSQILSIREREYIEACRAMGMPSWRILYRHALPNVLSAPVVYATLDITQVILTVSALSFLGLGAQPPTPDWGAMINEGQSVIYTSWWICTFPGIAVMITALAFSLLGDGLADALAVPL